MKTTLDIFIIARQKCCVYICNKEHKDTCCNMSIIAEEMILRGEYYG